MLHGLREGEEEEKEGRLGENGTGIDFVLLRQEHRRFLLDVKAVPGEFQHVLVVEDMDKKRIWDVVRKTYIERRKKNLLKD